MLRRLVWTVLPALALGTGVAEARVLSAVSVTFEQPADAPYTVSDELTVDADDYGEVTPVSDLRLANGSVPAAHRPAHPAAAPASRSRLPEPATWVMLIGGMYGIGAVLRRRHRASEEAFTARMRAIAEDRAPDGE